MSNFTDIEHAALERLLTSANKSTSEPQRVANFLLAWWNAGTCGGYNPTDAWFCDDELVEDMLVIFAYISRNPRSYPDSLGYCEDFENLVRKWRPELSEAK